MKTRTVKAWIVSLSTWILFPSLGSASDASTMEERLAKFESPRSWGVDLSYTPRRYENYYYTDTFRSSDAGYGADISFEWLPISSFGKLGIGFGTGFTIHANTVIATTTEDEVATLYTLPFSALLSYRADFVKNQIIVPYGKIGASLTLIKQSSSFGYSRSGLQRFTAFEYAAGLELNLNPLEPSAAIALDRSTGINATYFFAEYRGANGFGDLSYDLSRKEWRFGMRFEF